jgi:hypothetical protein
VVTKRGDKETGRGLIYALAKVEFNSMQWNSLQAYAASKFIGLEFNMEILRR